MSDSAPMFNRLKRPPAYKIIADALQAAIMDKQIKPGEALPTEAGLAAQFGVNRSTVREGIRHMEQSGLIVRQGKKMIVSKPSYDQVGDQVSKALIVHNVTFEELWQVKMVLEPLSAGLAAERVSADQLQKLEKNLAETAAALEDPQRLVALDIAFHTLISDIANNKALQMARGAISRLFYPAYQLGMSPAQAAQRLLDAHTLIFNAIKDGDNEKASDWMNKHIVDFKRGYELAGMDVNEPVPYRQSPDG